MQRMEINLQELLEKTIQELQPETEGRNIVWKKGALPPVQADPSLLRQVFANLLANAIKYSRPRDPAEIEIGSIDKPEETVIFIRDNGVGFDPQYADKLFGVFQRLHSKDDFEGTGIGLANVRRIIARHGGRTWAEGEVNQGATFYFSLPRPAGAP
jgi:light-regulated signal transduction histidine kinase (bacteriophytochrome)